MWRSELTRFFGRSSRVPFCHWVGSTMAFSAPGSVNESEMHDEIMKKVMNKKSVCVYGRH